MICNDLDSGYDAPDKQTTEKSVWTVTNVAFCLLKNNISFKKRVNNNDKLLQGATGQIMNE